MITIKSLKEIEIMAENGKTLAVIMNKVKSIVKPGVTTKELNELAQELILKSKAKCSFKGHGGFPACLCVSLNEEVVHGIPGNRVIKKGDIVSLDLGLFYNGYHSDMAITMPVGKTSLEAIRLIETARDSLEKGIEQMRPGKTLGDIGFAIQNCIESRNFSVVRELCGHGIGKELHEDPQVLNFGKPGLGQKIKEGMVLCLEPMVSAGGWRVDVGEDGISFKTADNSLSSHYEHMIAVLKNGPKILTVC
jgi:methionyl aminopeptidase